MNDKKLSTGLTVLAFIIAIVGLIISIRIMIGYEDVIGAAITMSLVLIGAGALVAILFGLVQVFTNLKKNMSMLIGLVVFIILGFICYSLASDEVLRTYENVTPSTSKLSGGGLYLTYILIIGAALAAVLGEVTRAFK